MSENSSRSRKRRSDGPPALDADRRFALLVALIAPDRRDRAHSLPRRDEGDPQARSSSFDRPAGEGAQERPRLRWQDVIVLLFVGCVVAAVLFIVAAASIQF